MKLRIKRPRVLLTLGRAEKKISELKNIVSQSKENLKVEFGPVQSAILSVLSYNKNCTPNDYLKLLVQSHINKEFFNF